MKILKHLWLISTAIFFFVCLTACSREFSIRPTGQLDQQVTFHFYKSIEADTPVVLNVVEFLVQEKKTDSNWQIVWELRGKQSLNAITYSKKYEGLNEIVSAKPFTTNSKYRVLASELGWFSPIGYSAVYFSFDESGDVMAIDPE